MTRIVLIALAVLISVSAFAETENDAEFYCKRGIDWFEKGDYDKAISDYNKAIEINPRYAKAYANRGYAYRAKGEYDKALEDFRKAERLGEQVHPGFIITFRKALRSIAKTDVPLDVLVWVIILLVGFLVGILLQKRVPSYEKKRTESLKIFGPQVPLSSSPTNNSIPKFKESTGVMGLAFDEPLAGCLFGVNGLACHFPGSSNRKARNIMEGNIGSIDFVTFDYSYDVEKEYDQSVESGTAILFQSDQLSLPSFKWGWPGRPSRRRMEFQPKTPPRAQEEAGRKQCKTCGNWDVRWAMIEDGGLGDWCPNCTKSFCKMNEEKVRELSKVMSHAYYPKWKALASNTQLLLYLRELVDTEEYQEFMEEALQIFQLFQSASQKLNEHA